MYGKILKILNKLNVCTWNVRSLGVPGKLENLLLEMKRLNMEIVGISEIKWKDQGDIWNSNYRIIYSGDEKGIAGVGIVLNKDWGNRVKNVVMFNKRIILIKLQINDKEILNVIQIYMPTSRCTEEELEELYEQIDEVWEMIDRNGKVIILGDWNAVVGTAKEENITGSYGYGTRNERGDRFIEFCREKDLVIANTLFKQPMNRRYTWIRPGNTGKFQIDYILIRRVHLKHVLQCKTYPGADINSDHNLLFLKTRLDSKRKIVKTSNRMRYDLTKLQDNEHKENYQKVVNNKIKSLKEIPSDINDKWNFLKNSIKEAALQTLGTLKIMPRKPWIDGNIIKLIEERRKCKNLEDIEGRIRYKHLKNLVNRESRKAKEEWLQDLCTEIDTNLKRGKIEKAYSLIKKYFGKKKMIGNSIEDENGKLLLNDNDIVNRWKRYIENLYNDMESLKDLEEEGQNDNVGLPITRDEFDKALNNLKGKKACGKDRIPSELVKALDEDMKDLMFLIIQDIYDSGNIPDDFKESEIVILPKKAKSRKCEDYRTLSLLSHTSKILTGIVQQRIKQKVDHQLHDDQFGFRNGRGTREAILSLRMLIEESMRIDKPLFIAFVDLQKAFDNVNWNILFEILKEIGVDYKDRKIIHSLYKNQTANVQVNNSEWQKASIRKGVRQGCKISPDLFNVYIEKVINECKEFCTGIILNGLRIQMLRFADDIAVLAPDEMNLRRILEIMDDIFKKYHMNINMKKTEVLVCAKEREDVNIMIGTNTIKQTHAFKYLGSTIDENGKSTSDIKQRIAQAKTSFNKKKR
uniref:Craniofacial development protein 2 n=1 Tax=Cacopsylla melanoneura TaxID=428564 RepID=A0A8D9E3Z3_9HEMI